MVHSPHSSDYIKTVPATWSGESITVSSYAGGPEPDHVYVTRDDGDVLVFTRSEARKLAAALVAGADQIEPPASDETAVRLLAEHYQRLGCPGTVDPNDPEDRLNVAAESIRVLRQAGFLRNATHASTGDSYDALDYTALDYAYACHCGRIPECATGEGCDPDDA